MKDDVHSLPAEELRDLSRECSGMIREVCAKLGYDDEMEAAVRRLMRSENLLAEFAAAKRESPATALRVLNAALATLSEGRRSTKPPDTYTRSLAGSQIDQAIAQERR